jgi:nucleotide-binding universal stress UspA family protein
MIFSENRYPLFRIMLQVRKHIAGEAGFDTLLVLAVANEVVIAEIPEQAGEVTEQIENIAANIGAGAAIAGAYGHSRLRE